MRLAVASVLLVACQATASPGTPCARPSDCPSPLVCSFGSCHEACRVARDCPVGARCLAVPHGSVCSLDPENHCDTHVCPSPLVCVSDECRTSCTTNTDCVAGVCAGTSCAEPVSTASDAGDASIDAPTNDATLDASSACVLPVPASAGTMLLRAAAGGTLGTHLAIAAAEVGASPTGWIHVAGIGDLVTGRAVPTAFVISVPQSDYAHPRPTVDLSGSPLFVYDARSIALRRNVALGTVQVLALVVDTMDSIGGGGIRGAAAHIAADGAPDRMHGADVVVFESWICSLAGCPLTVPAPMRIATFGRALIIGDGAASPIRYVFRWQASGMPIQLGVSQLDGTSMEYATAVNVPTTAFAELVGNADVLIAFRNDVGDAMVWNLPTPTPTRPSYHTTGPSLGGGRLALGDVATTTTAEGSFSHAVAYTDPTGDVVVDRLYCGAGCDTVTVATERRMDTAAGTDELASLAPAGHASIALATSRGNGSATLYVVDTALAQVTNAVNVFDAGTGRAIVDIQLASVRDGSRTHFATAILVGNVGSATGDEIWLTSTSLPTACL